MNIELKALAQECIDAIMHRQMITRTFTKETRPYGWPLPAKRAKGTDTQDYRPLSVLQYIDDTLSGAIKAKAQAERMEKRAKAKEGGAA